MLSISQNTLNVMIKKHLEETSDKQNEKYPAIDNQDLKILSMYFDRSSPQKLQQEVFYNLVFHFGMRGREWIHYNLTKESIAI